MGLEVRIHSPANWPPGWQEDWTKFAKPSNVAITYASVALVWSVMESKLHLRRSDSAADGTRVVTVGGDACTAESTRL